jgi:phage terminase small subunit
MRLKRAPKPLSEKHQMFVDKYLTCWNATEAYRAVYPKATYESARRLGSQLLTNVDIRADISKRLKEQSMEADEVLARLTDHARGNHRPFVRINEDGFIEFDFSNPEALEHLHLIKKIKTKRTRRVEGRGKNAVEWEDEWVEVELHDPQRALELLGKANKLFVERHEHTGKDGSPLGSPSIDIQALRKYLSDGDLNILQQAAEVIERAQRAHEAAVPKGH